MKRTRRSSPAFTLIEILVSIAVVAVLIAILVPALAAARTNSRMTKSLANLRQIGVGFESYLRRYSGVFPIGREGDLYKTDEPSSQSFEHFGFSAAWPVLTFEEMEFPEWAETTRGPWTKRQSRSRLETGYEYSCSFLARPELWDPAIEATMSMLGAVRESDVLFPTNKVLMWDRDLGRLKPDEPKDREIASIPTPTLFVDNHADKPNPRDANATEPNRLYTGYPWTLPAYHNTVNGARGRDFK